MSVTFEAKLRTILTVPFVSEISGALYHLKLETAETNTPLRAAEMFGEALGGSAHPRVLTFGSLHNYAQANGLIIRQAHPGGPGVIEMPIVRGAVREPAVPVSHRPVIAMRLQDAWITGRSGMIRIGDTLLADYRDEELAACPTDFRADPVIFDQPSDSVLTLIGPEDGPPLEEAICLVGCTSYNFGHWLLEYVFRFFVLHTQGLADGVPILIDTNLTQSQRDCLRLYTQGRHPIIEVRPFHTRHVRRLWVASNLCYVPIMPRTGVPITVNHISPVPAYAAYLAQEMTKAIGPRTGTPRRVYLARRMSLHRKLLNHVEITDLCRSAGFDIVYPEEHDFHYQFSLARGADVIMGPEGSAMLMAMHARPGTRILILNHPFLENLPTFTHFLDALGLRAEILAGECVSQDPNYRKMSDYTIAPDDLRQVFVEWGLLPAAPVPAPPLPEQALAPEPARPDRLGDLLRGVTERVGHAFRRLVSREQRG